MLEIVLAAERGSHNNLKRLKHFNQHLKKIHCHLRLLLLAIKSWKCNFGVIWSLIPAVFRHCGYTFWNTKKCQCGTKCNLQYLIISPSSVLLKAVFMDMTLKFHNASFNLAMLMATKKLPRKQRKQNLPASYFQRFSPALKGTSKLKSTHAL